MAITRVAMSTLKFGNAGFTSDAIDTSSLSGANGLLVVPLASYEAGATVSDNKGNTYTPLTQYGAEGRWARIWYCLNPAVGSGHTITVAGAATYDNGCLIAYSGVSAYDTSTGSSAFNPTTISPGSINPAGSGELFITMASTYTSDITTIDTATSGFTVLGHLSGTESMAVAELIEITAASKNPVWTNPDTAKHMACAMAAFTPAASGGGGSIILPPYLFDTRAI